MTGNGLTNDVESLRRDLLAAAWPLRPEHWSALAALCEQIATGVSDPPACWPRRCAGPRPRLGIVVDLADSGRGRAWFARKVLEQWRNAESPSADLALLVPTPRLPADLVDGLRHSGIGAVAFGGAPAAVVVGDVVQLRESLAWFERLPLFGKRVLVTRTAEQSASLRDTLQEAGAEAVVIPMIRIEPIHESPEIDAAFAELAEYDVLLLTSANAARHLAACAEERGCDLAGLRADVVCVGPATAAAALEVGFPVDRVPVSRFDAEGMLDEIRRELPPKGRRFLLPRAAKTREVLPEGLRAAGARVDTVAVYRTVPAPVDWENLGERLVQGEFDVLTFASPSAVRHFFGGLDASAREAAGRCTVATIGPVTAAAVRAAGIEPEVVPERAEAGALVEALAEHAARRARDA